MKNLVKVNMSQIHPHPLIYTSKSNWSCDHCHHSYINNHSFFCNICDFNYCQTCRAYKVYSVHFHSLNYIQQKNWTCEICTSTYEYEKSFNCEKCQFNCCQNCFSTINSLYKLGEGVEIIRKDYEDILSENDNIRKKAVNYFYRRENQLKREFYASVLKDSLTPFKEYTLTKKWAIEARVNKLRHFQKRLNDKKLCKGLFMNKLNKMFEKQKFFKEPGKMPHLKVYLLGKVGAGKNELINSIFKNKEEKVTQVGNRKSNEVYDIITSKSIPWITLYNTREINSKDYPIEKILSTIKKEKMKLIKSKKPLDNSIHVVWYCTNGEKLIESEEAVLSKLMDTCKNENLPVIITYTKVYSKDKPNIIIEFMKKKFKGKLNEIKFCSITGCTTDEDEKGNKETKIVKSTIELSFIEGIASIISSKLKHEIIKRGASIWKKFSKVIRTDTLRLLNRTFSFQERALEHLLELTKRSILRCLKCANSGIYELEKPDRRAIKAYINGNFKKYVTEEFKRYKREYTEEKGTEISNKVMDLLEYTEIKFGLKMHVDKSRICIEIKDYVNQVLGSQIDCVIVKETALIFGRKFFEQFGKLLFLGFSSGIKDIKNRIKEESGNEIKKLISVFG